MNTLAAVGGFVAAIVVAILTSLQVVRRVASLGSVEMRDGSAEYSRGEELRMGLANQLRRQLVHIHGFEQEVEFATRLPSWRREAAIFWSSEGMHLEASVGHPRLISKGHTSAFVVHTYLPPLEVEVRARTEDIFRAGEAVWHPFRARLKVGCKVSIKLPSDALAFRDPVMKELSEFDEVTITGTPQENCLPGLQSVTLSITDAETDFELFSAPFEVTVVDRLVDGISRPAFAHGVSAVAAIGSVILWTLAVLGEVNDLLGVASGATGLALAGVVEARAWKLYRRLDNPRIARPK